MRLHLAWTAAILAIAALTGAAFADVTVSRANDPTAQIEEQFASLMGAERQTLAALPAAKLASLVAGPQAVAKPGLGKWGQKPAPVAIEYTEQWLATMDVPTGDAQWECLKTALYFEARGETVKGQFAVAEVILNRVASPRFPSSVCAVVKQRGGGGCQFSYVCDGARDTMREAAAAVRAGRIARVMLDGAPRTLTAGATYFHSRQVRPGWARGFDQTAAIGAHLFYAQY